MKIEEVRKMCEDLGEAYAMPVYIPIDVNPRMKRAQAHVRYTRGLEGEILPLCMEFNKQVVENATEEEMLELVKHEMAHYFSMVEENDPHHSANWRKWCRRLGCSTKARGEKDERQLITFKYMFYCSSCGKVLARRHRETKWSRNVERLTSQCCNAKVRLVVDE